MGRTAGAIRQKALDLVRYLPPKDWRGQINALFEFVRDSVRYVRDINDVETVADAEQVLKDRQGDCDDKSVLLAALLESIGHPARFLAVGFKPGVLSHVLVETRLGKGWVALETTEPVAMGWRPPGIVATMLQGV